MTWRSAPTDMVAFAPRHEWLSTSPDSGFVNVLTVQRRDATGVDVLRGLTLLRLGAGASETTLARESELVAALREFGFDVDAIGSDALGALWVQTHRAHLAWEAAGRP
jgi:arylamine N-acetyltransferase